MSSTEKLEFGKYYHIYNRGINSETLFHNSDNFQHFLRLYDKYINCIADTYAWCLMPYHFHFLVRVKEEEEIGYLLPLDSSGSIDSGRSEVEDSKRWKTSKDLPASEGPGRVNLKKPIPHRQFGHLFNSYSKYYNNLNQRTGSLFEKNFRRIEVTSEKYFKHLIFYIHNNPVHHGFVINMLEYPWSSYLTFVINKTYQTLSRKGIGLVRWE